MFYYLVCAFFGRYELDGVEILALFHSEDEAKHHIALLNAKLELLQKVQVEIDAHMQGWEKKFPEPSSDYSPEQEEIRQKHWDCQYQEYSSFAEKIGYTQGMKELIGVEEPYNPEGHIRFGIKTCPK